MSMLTGSRSLSAEMNVTPLVDVLLVLLIIFMLTPTPDSHGLDTKVPQQDDSVARPAQRPDENVVLQIVHGVGDQASVRINHKDVAWTDLAAQLREIYKTRATKVMFIQGDKDVEFAHVARAIDLAREADRGISIGLMSGDTVAD